MKIVNTSKILITGSRGLVGTALVDELCRQGYMNLCLPTRQECDLTNFQAVKSYFLEERPEVVFHNAAAVFGIGGNLKNPGKIFLDNILMNTHVIEASHLCGAQKIIMRPLHNFRQSCKVVPSKERDYGTSSFRTM